ncbi:MAG: hypothetical protein KatS3mg092_0660 [Patescibacteria group bacterium]|nr:MAG: hypothetical protein KatS3mg092_0660 [Patescibacteria group bacterium]
MKNVLIFIIFFLLTFFYLPIKILSKTVNLNFNPANSYGTADLYFGIKISSLDDETTKNIINNMANKNIYIKLIDPPDDIIKNPNFSILTSKGFKWCFSFNSNDKVSSFLSNIGQPPSDLIIEINNYNPNFIKSLKNQYPNINIHTSRLPFWPRDKVKNIINNTPPPIIEAISFYVENEYFKSNLFETIKLMFDTFFDAVSDIPGTSGIQISYPPKTYLSLSDIITTDKSADHSIVYTTGVISSAIVSSVQGKNKSKKAPFKYVFAGNYFSKNNEKIMLLTHIADFFYNNPTILWPIALAPNGEPFDIGNNRTIVGVIAYKSNQYYFILTNTANSTTTVNFSQTINFNNYSSFSTKKGKNFISGEQNQIILSPYESIVINPNSINVSIPSITLEPSNDNESTDNQKPFNKPQSFFYQPAPLTPNITEPTIKPQTPLYEPTPIISKSPIISNIIYPIITINSSNKNSLPFINKKNNLTTIVNFNITINNPYFPYRHITEAFITINNKNFPLLTTKTNFSLTLINQPTKYDLTVITNDNFIFKKNGWINFDKNNIITITTANPFLTIIKTGSDLFFQQINKIKILLKIFDRPFVNTNQKSNF